MSRLPLDYAKPNQASTLTLLISWDSHPHASHGSKCLLWIPAPFSVLYTNTQQKAKDDIKRRHPLNLCCCRKRSQSALLPSGTLTFITGERGQLNACLWRPLSMKVNMAVLVAYSTWNDPRLLQLDAQTQEYLSACVLSHPVISAGLPPHQQWRMAEQQLLFTPAVSIEESKRCWQGLSGWGLDNQCHNQQIFGFAVENGRSTNICQLWCCVSLQKLPVLHNWWSFTWKPQYVCQWFLST